MNLIEEAKALGFSDAAVISTDQLVFVPEYRVFCEDNLCGNYDKNPACPPQSGTICQYVFHNFIYFIILKYIFCVFFTINTKKTERKP